MTRAVSEFGVKTQLAKLLATENILLEHRPGIPTAYFDIKNRVLALPVWQNISNDLYDMLVVHETGHALDTPLDAWLAAIKMLAAKHHSDPKIAKRAEGAIKDFINVVEDARIDKRQKRRYPGSKRNYVAGLKELHERDFFGIKKKDIATLTFIDRVNIYFKGGTTMKIPFTAKEKGFIKRMDDAETFDEVIGIVDDIYEYARSTNQMKQQTQGTKLVITDDEGDGEGEEVDVDDIDWDNVDEIEDRRTGKSKKDGKGQKGDKGKKDKLEEKLKEHADKIKGSDGDEGDSEGNEKDDKSKSKSSGGSDKDEDGEGEDQEGESSGESKEDKGSEGTDKADRSRRSGGGSGFKDNNDELVPGDFVPESLTERAAEVNSAQIVLNSEVNYVYVGTPKFNIDAIVHDYKDVIPQMEKSMKWISDDQKKKYLNDFQTWRRAETDTISFMVKEFEMRKAADTHSRIKVAKTGVLDTNKLFSYKYNDDLFRKNDIVPQGKNHGFVMILDWSGSMQSELLQTMKQLYSLVLFCKRVGIPFDVYLFRQTTSNEDYKSAIQQRESMTLMFKNFRLRNFLSSRMNTSTLNRAMEIMWRAGNGVTMDSDPMGRTPLNESILCMHDIVNRFQKKHKVQVVSTIIMTDGGSDSPEGIWDEKQQPSKKGGNKYFIRDHITGKVYAQKNHPRMTYHDGTATYLEMLKERTQSNLVGFFLTNAELEHLSGYVDEEILKSPAAKKSWENDGFLGATTAGYDTYFLMSLAKIEASKKASQSLGSMAGKNTGQIAQAFTQFNQKKAVNRALLSRFIEIIANLTKKM